MMDPTYLIDVSLHELEQGFRKMKEILDEKNMDYKVLIFDIDTTMTLDPHSTVADEDKDADEIRQEMSEENLRTIPLMKEEFVEKVNESVLNDLEMAERIAIGC